MVITPHAVTGATIAVLFPNPVFTIPLAVASHYVLDTIPHWQETLPPYNANSFTIIRTIIDIIFTGFCLYYITARHPQLTPNIFVGAFAGILPDSDVIVNQFHFAKIENTKIYRNYWNWHCRIQRETASLLGIIPQVAVVIIGLFIVHFMS